MSKPQEPHLHLLRTAVGIESRQHLRDVLDAYSYDPQRKAYIVTTRNTPTRKDEILQTGGSLYWIIKRYICARQQILDLISGQDARGMRQCKIILNTDIVPVLPTQKKHIQGWRYFSLKDAPADLEMDEAAEISDMPTGLSRTLRDIGVV